MSHQRPCHIWTVPSTALVLFGHVTPLISLRQISRMSSHLSICSLYH